MAVDMAPVRMALVEMAALAAGAHEAGQALQLVVQAYLDKVLLAVQQYLEVLVGRVQEAAAQLLLDKVYLVTTQVASHPTAG
jgi:hypothetical protein